MCELVWLLYLAVLHAHMIDIKSNAFFWNVQPTKSVYWTHSLQVLEKVLRVIEKHKASAIPWWTHPHPSFTFPRLLLRWFLPPFHHGSLLPAFIIFQNNSYIVSPTITPVTLTCSTAGSDLISEERRVFIRISRKFLQHSLLTSSHVDTFTHNTLFPWEHSYATLLSFLHPHSQQGEKQRSRRVSFPGAPALFTPPKSFKYSAQRHPGPYYIRRKVLA